ncbi:rod shape-determining protein MreC [Rariglobus hedericola]|uniref:rod shape-determining protein MreC n=1 Tax=Rariglobus hedericola TaxID=2597822 RepID=UPI001EF0B4FA|nr:rod shape-determining protein MreC [Rariglobus hedericola]
MLPPRFDQAKPFLTLGIVLLAWLLIPTALKRVARTSFFELQAPFETTASYVRDLQDFWSLKTRPKNDLIEAGRDLARLNAAYEVRLQQDSALRNELERLERILKLPTPSGYRAEPARVVKREFSSWWQQLVIRKGSNHGITVGSPVIYAGGVVGRVREVFTYTSVVELISSPGVRIAATAEGDIRPISYQGAVNPSYGPAVGSVEYVPLDVFVTASSPRKLVTSGLGGVFPPNLTVGYITRVEPSSDGLFKSGDVRLDPELSSLNEVTVLVPEVLPPR